MDIAVEILKIVPTMSDHWPRERCQRLGRNLNRSRNEKFIVGLHESILSDSKELEQSFPSRW